MEAIQERFLVNTLSSTSAPSTPRTENTKAADDAWYRRLFQLQSYRASSCLLTPAQQCNQITKARFTGLKSLPKRSWWLPQLHTLNEGPNLPNGQQNSDAPKSTIGQGAHPGPFTGSYNRQAQRTKRESTCRGFAGDTSAKSYSHPTSQENTKTDIPKKQEPRGKLSKRNSTVELCVETNTELERPHNTVKMKENAD